MLRTLCLAVLLLCSAALSARGAGIEPGTVETFRGQEGRFSFRLLARKGEEVLATKGDASLEGAKRGIAPVQANRAEAAKHRLPEAAHRVQMCVELLSGVAVTGS